MKPTRKKQKDDILLPSLTSIKKDFALLKGHDDIKNSIFDCMKLLSSEGELEKRALLLNKLIEYSNQLDGILSQLKDNPDDEAIAMAIAKNLQLQAMAAYMLKSITNTWTNEQLKAFQKQETSDIDWNKKHNALWKSTDQTKLKWGMLKERDDFDKEHNVTRLKDDERENHRVFLDNGAVKEFVLVGSGEDSQLVLRNFDTKNMTSGDRPGACIFVVSRQGKIYASNTEMAKFHHSSLGGDAVSFAGAMEVKQGRIKYLDNSSGHYQPSDEALESLSMMLTKVDAIDSSTKLEAYIPNIGLSESNFPTPLESKRREQIHSSSPYTISNPTEWRKESSAGLFALRYKEMKKIDFALENFQKNKHLRSPSENIKILNDINGAIKEQRQSHPDSKRATAINELETQVNKAINYFQDLLKNENAPSSPFSQEL